MAENKNTFQTTVESLMKGMDGFVSSKTVVGEPIQVGETIILPLVDVSFGMGAGAFCGEKKKNSGGGIGGKMSPSSVLVIQNGRGFFMCNRTSKQLAGFILFWIGIGMIVMLFMPNDFVGILISGGFLLLGYTLYQM